MDITILTDLGLTNAEANLYLVLLECGPSRTGTLIRKTGLHKATVYQTLHRLEEKGIVSHIIDGNARSYIAVRPQQLLQSFKEKETRFSSAIAELEKKAENQTIEAQIFRGINGIMTVYRDMLTYQSYFTIGAKIPIKEVLGHYFNQIQMMKKERKIKAKMLISESRRNTDFARELYGERRFMPKHFDGPTSTMVYGDKVAIIVWNEKIAFIIKSKDTSAAYKKYFDLLWKDAAR